MALALSGIATASASATTCPNREPGLVLCSEGHALEGTFEFKSGGSGEFSPESSGGSRLYTLGCTGPTTGKLVAKSGKVEISDQTSEWSCTFTGHATCKKTPFKIGPGPGGVNGAWTGTGEGPAKISLAPSEKQLFAELVISQCEQQATYDLKGTQSCTMPSSNTEKIYHEIECPESGSELQWGERPAVLTSKETLSLPSGKPFSIQKG